MNPITRAYRDALAAIVSSTLGRVMLGWLTLWTDDHPIWSSARAGELAAIQIEGAQLAAAELSARYLAALTASARGVPIELVGGYGVPPGLVGSSASGSRLRDLTTLVSAIWWARLLSGASRADASAAAAGWLGRLASSEPYRAANATVIWNALTDPRLRDRINRVTSPGACSFCLLIRDRGYTRARAGFSAHANCHCTAEPEIG